MLYVRVKGFGSTGFKNEKEAMAVAKEINDQSGCTVYVENAFGDTVAVIK